jgi:hypothetical protein
MIRATKMPKIVIGVTIAIAAITATKENRGIGKWRNHYRFIKRVARWK